MKKIRIFLITMIACIFSTNAQSWNCEAITNDINNFNSANNRSNKKWAENLTKIFTPNADGEAELTYVIQCTDSVPRNELIAKTEGWLNTVFTNARNQIEVSNENQLICKGDLGQVAFDQSFIGATRIMAPIEITILYKVNRVRLSLITRNYRMAYANIGQLESNVIKIANVYPFDKSSKHKGAYAMAYINTMGKLLNLADGYLRYLNLHKTDALKDIPEW